MMKKVIIFGSGNIGSVLKQELSKRGIIVRYVVRSDSMTDCISDEIIEKHYWRDVYSEVDAAFVCIPSNRSGEQSFEYASFFLENKKLVVTCEKAALAYHWDFFKHYQQFFGYTACVGGGTKMLRIISDFNPEEIFDIKAVVNGTLNYISDGIRKGQSKVQIIDQILEKGYSEPGADSFEEIIQKEFKDMIFKAVIMANHWGIFDKIIKPEDIEVEEFNHEDILIKSCAVRMNKDKIQAGFIEKINSDWLPDGVNNVLYINGERKAFGPGAGAEATAGAMIEDFDRLLADK